MVVPVDPELVEPEEEDLPPPAQPLLPIVIAIAISSMRSGISLRRRGMHHTMGSANAATTRPAPQFRGLTGAVNAADVGAVVRMVSVVVPLPPAASEKLAGDRLQVGTFCAPEGDGVSVHTTFIVPL